MSRAGASLVVTADDSTGAIEAAAACADAGFSVQVIPIGVSSLSAVSASGDGCVVIDLRSRHVAPPEARRRIRAVPADAHRVHKIDSTLRGNWAEELAALVDGGRRVVLIPSHPSVGRVCVGGVVYVGGVPLADSEHGNDPRLPVRSSRPGDMVAGDELADAAALAAWLDQSSGRMAIVDAATLDEIERLVVVALGAANVVLAGPASVVGAVAAALAPAGHVSALPVPLLVPPVVAVCASLHPASRAQMAGLTEVGVEVVISSDVRGNDPDAVAAEVAERAHRRVADVQARSVILVGGDTAAAFIGDNVVRVFGSVGVGVSLGEAQIRGRVLRLAAKPGGFGASNTLVDLVRKRSAR